MISIVLPVYRSGAFIEEIYRRIISLPVISGDCEIIFVNDGCPENSWEIIRRIAEKDKRLIGVNLSRNFGQHYAITAGLEISKGEVVIVMDCDLQEDPADIPILLKKLENDGSQIVLTLRKKEPMDL